jgi:hypothetical protein
MIEPTSQGGGQSWPDFRQGEDMAETIPIGATVMGIRCRIGRAEVALALPHVGQIIEYPVFPLPLARRWIGGLGLHDEQPLISVALARTQERPRGEGTRTARGILLDGESREVGWALEVDELGSFVRVTVSSRPASEGLDVPPWISQARDDAGRTLGWIDVPAMVADLTSEVR